LLLLFAFCVGVIHTRAHRQKKRVTTAAITTTGQDRLFTSFQRFSPSSSHLAFVLVKLLYTMHYVLAYIWIYGSIIFLLSFNVALSCFSFSVISFFARWRRFFVFSHFKLCILFRSQVDRHSY